VTNVIKRQSGEEEVWNTENMALVREHKTQHAAQPTEEEALEDERVTPVTVTIVVAGGGGGVREKQAREGKYSADTAAPKKEERRAYVDCHSP